MYSPVRMRSGHKSNLFLRGRNSHDTAAAEEEEESVRRERQTEPQILSCTYVCCGCQGHFNLRASQAMPRQGITTHGAAVHQ